MKMRLIKRGTRVDVVNSHGTLIAQFDSRYRDHAEAFVMMPKLLALLHAVVDGAEGYVSEVGDDSRYWQAGVVDEARLMVDKFVDVRGEVGKP